MKNESDPITDDEWLLRRVHTMWFKNERVPIISLRAFEPRIDGRDPDINGISLYREECLNSAEEILSIVAEDKRPDQGIVRLPVRAFLELQLGVQSKPDARIKGHVLIPGLNANDYAAAKGIFTSVLLSLATMASQDQNIVLWPRSLR